MVITGHHKKELHDPTGILEGNRYEFILHIEVTAEDEMHSEHGLYIKLIYATDVDGGRIAQYQIFEDVTHKYLDFALDEEELEMLISYCKEEIEYE